MCNKFIIFSLLAFLMFSPSKAQIIFFEDFNDVPLVNSTGDIPEEWTLYNDNGYDPHYSYMNKAWKVREAYGSKRAVSTSWFSDQTYKTDRWMITPAIDLSGVEKPYLLFNPQASSTERESYIIKVSTTGLLKESFTETIFSTTNEDNREKIRAVSLEKFIDNETVHIAFILNSVFKQLLYIDDITVIDLINPIVTVSDLNAPILAIMDVEINISAKASMMYHDVISSYQINYSIDDDVFTHKVENQNIGNMQSFTITVPEFVISQNGVYNFKLWLSHFNEEETVISNALEQTIEVTDKTYYPRNSLLESFSSSSCSPCRQANIYIKEAYSSLNANSENANLFVIKYQVPIPNNLDPAVTEESIYKKDYYNISSAPSLFLNGSSYVGAFNNMLDELPPKVEAQLNNKTPFWLEASMERTGREYKVDVTILNTGQYNDARLYIAFVEDSIYHTRQSNGETSFYYVFRKFLPSAYGKELKFTESGETTLSFEYTFDMESPEIFNTLDRVSAVVFMQNYGNREILQAIHVPAIKGSSAINSQSFKTIERRVVPNPSNGKSNLHLTLPNNEKLEIVVYDVKGQAVKTIPAQNYGQGEHIIDISLNNLPAGFYFAKIISKNGIFTEKIILF